MKVEVNGYTIEMTNTEMYDILKAINSVYHYASQSDDDLMDYITPLLAFKHIAIEAKENA